MNPSIRDGERAALVDETVEVLSNVIWVTLGVYLPRVLNTFCEKCITKVVLKMLPIVVLVLGVVIKQIAKPHLLRSALMT